MDSSVIKSFLVGLGFGVDDTSLAKFNKAITSATVRVAALYGSIKIMAAANTLAITKMSESFEQLGYEYRIIAPAINKALVLRRELLKAYAAAGINLTQVIQNSIKLNMSIAKTKFALEALYKSVGSRFFELLTKQSDAFRKKLYENMPRIQNALERFVKFIFKAFEATTTLGLRLWSILSRVYDFFVMLDKATEGWSTIILGVVAAWKLLNLSFLATPLGMIITGLVALLALFDDFKTWQEGGESLFNWTDFVPVIEIVSNAVKSLRDVLGSLLDIVGRLLLAFSQLFSGDFSGFFDSMKQELSNVIELFTRLWGIAKGFFGAVLTNSSLGALTNPNVAANLGGNPVGAPLANPVPSATQNSQTNQNVSQQTSINISGSADASSVGKAVAGEQGRVNFDMVRNMRGATR